LSQTRKVLLLAALSAVALTGSWNLWAGFAAAGLLALILFRTAENQGVALKDYARRLARFDFGEPAPGADDGPFGVRQALQGMQDRLKVALIEAAAKRESLETALNAMQDGLLVFDAQGRLSHFNLAAKALLGTRLQPHLGTPLRIFYPDPELVELVELAMQGRTLERQLRKTYADGKELKAFARSLEGGGVLLFLYDTTEPRRLERLRREFVSNVSHELKTPLTAIKSAVETLEEGAVDDRTVNRGFLRTASQHVGRLQDLIQELLDLARMEEAERLGGIDRSARTSVDSSVVEAVGSLAQLEKQTRARIRVLEIAPSVEVHCEHRHLVRMVGNLLENAMKYGGPDPQIELSAKVEDGVVEIRVEDRGPGLGPEALTRVFERFYREDASRSREHGGGSGLGLAIVRQLAEGYGGGVEAQNRPEGGCRFALRLPRVT
jgi:two-component system phosphate regulon sensor histidine kinase PhoR